MKMAGYRDRMVHFYGEIITGREIYNIIQEELEDFYTFLTYISVLLKNPEKFNLSITKGSISNPLSQTDLYNQKGRAF